MPGGIVRKVDLSWIVVYSNIWVEISGRIVGTISRQRSQTSSLINQRSRPTYANQMCFYPRLFVDVDRRFSAAPSYTRTLSPLSLSVSPCVCPLSVLYKNPIAPFIMIIEIQDFSVTGCSYSIGSTNTKLVSPDWDEKFSVKTKNKREKVKTSRKSFCQNFGVFYFS